MSIMTDGNESPKLLETLRHNPRKCKFNETTRCVNIDLVQDLRATEVRFSWYRRE